MNKTTIENCGLSGLPLTLADVARVSRSRRVATLRHVWSENVDARIWSGVRRAYALGAQALANKIGKSVEVYARDGYMLACFEYEEGGTTCVP